MKDFIAGFGSGVLQLFEMSFSLLCIGAVKPSESITGEKQVTDDRSYTPDPDFKEPEEEYPIIQREV